MKYILFLFIGAVVVAPNLAESRIGVGIGTGKIEVTEVLMPGKTYDLPLLAVINTGDEVSDYGAGISYHEQQAEMMPPEAWFVFSPERFTLEPGQSQPVSITLNIPARAAPGNYFAYVEAPPIVSSSGQTRVNVAAAAKLNFEVGISNLAIALYYKAVSVWGAYSPWTNRIAIVILAIGIVFAFKNFFRVQVNFKK